MHSAQAVLWTMLLAGADAQFRALRRDSGICSMEIVATVTKTYTITTSEEVVLPCHTAGDDGSAPHPHGDAPSGSATTTTASPEPSSNPDKGNGDSKERLDSNLPFDSLIPSDYFPEITIVEPTGVLTEPSFPDSTPELTGSPDEEESSATASVTITTAIKPAEPSDAESTESYNPTATNNSEPENPDKSGHSTPSTPESSSKPSLEPEMTQTSDSSSPGTTQPGGEGVSASTEESSATNTQSASQEPVQTSTATPAEELPSQTTAAAEVSTSSTNEEVITTTALETSASAVAPEPTLTRLFPADAVDKLQDSSMDKLRDHLKRNVGAGCTLENAAVRREWGDLSVEQRKEYAMAVQCLKEKPARTPSNVAKGAKSRFDDFVVTHIQQTQTIHNTASFLSWHRYFTWAYEQALRNECGYTGYQPYWNWARYTDDPAKSPIFDGSEGSLGGNSNNNGCAAKGPFKDLTVNLGPGNNLNYNPRCLKRDISRYWAQQCTADKTMSVLNESDIGKFQDHMQYGNSIHAGGHFTIGGDPGGDVYSSPADPVFWLHHAMVDRVWWIWQLQDLSNRLTAVTGRVGGGSTRQGTLQDSISLGYAAEGTVLGELMDTTGGKGGAFCYIYY